jgi:hypothetical protein
MSDSDSDIFSPHTHILFNPTVFLRIFQVGSDSYNLPNHDIPMIIIMTYYDNHSSSIVMSIINDTSLI